MNSLRVNVQKVNSLTNTAKIRPGTSLARFKDASHNQKKTRAQGVHSRKLSDTVVTLPNVESFVKIADDFLNNYAISFKNVEKLAI